MKIRAGDTVMYDGIETTVLTEWDEDRVILHHENKTVDVEELVFLERTWKPLVGAGRNV